MHNRYFWLKGILVLVCGSLLTACAHSTHRSGGRGDMTSSVPSSACIGNAYLQKYGCSTTRIDQAAKSGDPDAQYALGYMYYYGIGTVRDKDAAKLWIGRAAKQGQPLAQKARTLMDGGQGLHSLHGGVGRSDHGGSDSGHSSARNATQYSTTPNVDALNSAIPNKPIDQVLPNYGSKPAGQSGKPESVIKSLQKKSKKVVPSDSSPANSPSVEPITRLHDPRLTPNAKPITTVTATAKARGAMTAAERAMLSTPKKHYTLQLMGGRNLGAIQSFMRKHHLQNKAHFYSAQLNHKRWYMLVYGDYSSMRSAHLAIKQLPPSIQAAHPWIKSYRTVHNEIRLRRVVS